ncbi:tetratricopeptide repeat protein [Phaeovulum sp.]|uniref:tetratricopeptide repeat protein n=1 Tax=Phaeovulum sp. TaxID=2934796 RepID=UPI0039E5278B
MAQHNLGIIYANGLGVPQDHAEAVKWYRLAADQGYASAQNNLGLTYESGLGVPQDYIAAHIWYNIAGSNGSAKAISNRDRVLAMMQPVDISEAQRRAKVCLASNYTDCD